jgi:YD repeat-containing protein
MFFSNYTTKTWACVLEYIEDKTKRKNEYCVGNPIFPATATKRESVPLGIRLAGRVWSMTYDSSLLAPILAVDGIASRRGGRPLGGYWASGLHRSLVIQNGGISAIRGDGQVVEFRVLNYSFLPDADIKDRLYLSNNTWRYIDAVQNSVEVYDAIAFPGRLLSISYADGNRLDFVYSDPSTPSSVAPAAGYLLSAVDHFGRRVDLEYDLPAQGNPTTDGVIKRARTSSGDVIDFEYSGSKLSYVRWPSGERKGFLYGRPDFPYLLTGIVDEAGAAVTTFTYDQEGRAIGTFGAGGVNSFSVGYAFPPKVVSTESYDRQTTILRRTYSWTLPTQVAVQGPLGVTSSLGTEMVLGQPRVTSQSQSAGSGCAASASAQTYDANANLTSRDDFNGNRVCYLNDLRNLEAARVEGLPGGATGTVCGTVTGEGAALPVGARKVSTQWHPFWRRLQTLVVEPSKRTAYVYNGDADPTAGNAVASCAPPTALLPDGIRIPVLCKKIEQATTDINGSQGFSGALQPGVAAREQRWTYNEYGQVLTHDGPRTDVADTTTYEYYTTTAFTGADPNAVGATRGDLKKVTLPVGGYTLYRLYNKVGQVLQTEDANGVVTNYTYDARQRMTSMSVAGQTTTTEYWPTGLIKRVTQPDASWVYYEHDDAHRLVQVSDNLGNSITYTLDNLGQRVGEQAKDPNGVLRRKLNRSIDALGRVQQITGRE